VVRAKAQEAEFEATLGGLVERFTALPPPVYGEPPDLALAEGQARPRAARRRSPVSIWIGSLALGGLVAGGALVGLRVVRGTDQGTVAPVVVPTPAPEVKIVIKNAAVPVAGSAAPQAEPIREVDPEPATPPARPAASDTARSIRADRTAAIRGRGNSSKSHRIGKIGKSRKRLAAVTGDEGKDWDDPYK
jgi:hypothetical protein